MSDAFLLPLRTLMQSLPDEQSAGRAQCALSFFKAADVPELLEVVLDPACDHPDDDASWIKASQRHEARSANWELAKKLIELAPEFVERRALQLVKRRSNVFRHRLLEFLLEKKCQPLDRFLQLALAEQDGSCRRSYLHAFKLGLVRAQLSAELRDRLYELLEPCWLEPQDRNHQVDYWELLNLVQPERAQRYFDNLTNIDPQHPQLASILRQPGLLRSPNCKAELYKLFDYFTHDSRTLNSAEVDLLACVVNAAIAKHSPEYLPLLEMGAARPEPKVRRLSLDGVILLKLPHNPVRKAGELVRSKRRARLSEQVRVVGFASLYAELFNVHEVLGFAENVSAKEYAACMEALGALQELEHLALLTNLFETLGDDPRAALKRIRGARREKLWKRFGSRAEKLDMDQLEESIHRYVLKHEDEFAAIRGMEID